LPVISTTSAHGRALKQDGASGEILEIRDFNHIGSR